MTSKLSPILLIVALCAAEVVSMLGAATFPAPVGELIMATGQVLADLQPGQQLPGDRLIGWRPKLR